VNNEINQRAERLCYAIAGRDLGDTPLYLVRQSSLPNGHFAGEHHYAFTTPSLDIYLRDYIPGYRGRGPCMLLNDLAMAEDWDDLPAYYGHELGFIRIALHLCHRASLAGVGIASAAICAGHRYRLSHASEYQEALGDEPQRCVGMLFRDIAATDPPLAFRTLWATDFVAYHDHFRFFPLKGV
jgi:hypothetical protein